MGIFSLFGKKESAAPEAQRELARKKRVGTPGPAAAASPIPAKRKIAAQATALKIDEIESEMSSEFIKYSSNDSTLPGLANTTTRAPATLTQDSLPAETLAGNSGMATAARAATPVDEALEETFHHAALSVSESMPAVEEAAILYANGQSMVAEQVLHAALQDAGSTTDSDRTVWNMLFDLYILNGKQAEFETLSIDYASKFETSPPTWADLGAQAQAAPAATRATPAVAFSGKLDAGIAKQLERVKNLAASNPSVRLEFSRVADVDPAGCGILLAALQQLQKAGKDLVLVGALQLAERIRAILQVGRRDETEAPWLLLLEILRMLNLEKDFEDTSMDYCITFEVSPPAFVAPDTKITTATDELARHDETDHFAMPAVIEGKPEQLLQAIAAYAQQCKPAVLDCTRLRRVDFNAAGHLLTGLAPLVARGAELELRHVNHLVAALFQVIGVSDLARVAPRKM